MLLTELIKRAPDGNNKLNILYKDKPVLEPEYTGFYGLTGKVHEQEGLNIKKTILPPVLFCFALQP